MFYVDKSIRTSLMIHTALQTIVLYFKLMFLTTLRVKFRSSD